MAVAAPVALSFGPFMLTGAPRRLSIAGEEVPLAPLCLSLLAALAERQGDMVDEGELMERVGSHAAMDRTRLVKSVAAINRALEERAAAGCYIARFPGEGLMLVVRREAKARAWRVQPPLTSIIGRNAEIERVVTKLPEHRLATIVGMGGIGKTTVALAVAAALETRFEHGACFVDLAPLADPALLPGAVAAALGLHGRHGDALAAIQGWLGDKHMLLVLDSCEHVRGEAAHLAQAVVGCGARMAVLATSREPLQASGEWVERLQPMRLPANGSPMTAERALTYSAVELFVERARAADAGFVLHDAQAEMVVSLCRRVDGIPLAIEIVAARVAELGVEGLAAQVDRRGLELTSKRRGRPARHHTLSALLDWSYESLSDVQQMLLRRLAVFRGAFTLEAATAVAAEDHAIELVHADAVLRELVAKSLVAQVLRRGADYRLPDTTRIYLERKLDTSADCHRVRARHARYVLHLMEGAEAAWERLSRADWLQGCAPWIDDVRAALAWAFSPEGDASIGSALVLASFPVARQMGMEREFLGRIEQCLALLAEAPALLPVPPAGDARAARAREALLLQAMERTIRDDDCAAAARHRAVFLSALWVSAIMRADYRAAARLAACYRRTARSASDPLGNLVASRMLAQSMHFAGLHGSAARLAQRLVEPSPCKIPLRYLPSPIATRVWMEIILARILWLRGLPAQAAAMAGECLDHARANGALGHCQALALAAVPIALWTGQDAACGELVALLREVASRHAITQWQAWGERYGDVLERRVPGSVPAEEGHPVGPWREPDANLQDHLCTLDARYLTDAQLERVETGMVGWCAPEILRLHGERLLVHSAADHLASGEVVLIRALGLARRQKALAWELRTATSLARLWVSRNRRKDAFNLLAPVHARFSEGLGTPDWLSASVLLAQL